MRNQSLESLYADTIDPVFRYVYSRVRNRQLAEDLVSETYLKVAEHYAAFDPKREASTRSWVFTIARNTLNDYFRKPATAELLDEHPSKDPALDHALDIDLAYSTAIRAADTLPARQREIVLLKFQGELRNKEIATLLHIDERSVSAALTKALSTLRNALYV